MELIRTRLAEGARSARGVAVIIDVFRAFTCEPVLISLGVQKLILEPDPERCRSMKTGDRVLLLGEVNERPVPGFDAGNSPHEILSLGRAFFQGTTVVHRTTAGVTGAAHAARNAEEVLLCSYVTAGAVARYIRRKNPSLVTLVAMGTRTLEPAPEDEACADYLEHLLTGAAYDHFQAVTRVLAHEQARKFLYGGIPYLPREDPVYCLQRDVFDFVLRARREGDRIVAEAEGVNP